MMSRNRIRGAVLSLFMVIALIVVTAFWMALVSGPAEAQSTAKPSNQELRAGRNFIETRTYSEQDDQEILKLFEGLRVSDVADGLDKVGLTNMTIMSPEIHAVWKDTIHYKHRFAGVAVTARYVPTNRPPAPAMETKPYDAWSGKWYSELSPEPFVPLIRKGTAVVIDDAPDSDVGNVGSNNIMGWKARG